MAAAARTLYSEEGDRMNCDYCQGNRDGYISFLPKNEKYDGNAIVHDGFFGSYILISLPFKKKLKYDIKFCPMCGRKLREGVKE